jgi:hypothetical protein
MRCSRRAFLERHSAALRQITITSSSRSLAWAAGRWTAKPCALQGLLQMEHPPDDVKTGNVRPTPALR